MDILVTGGTGKLGRALVERLRGDGRAPRVLSRTAGQGRVVGDLRTGAGIDDAVRGADVIVHCAPAPRGDAATTRTWCTCRSSASRRCRCPTAAPSSPPRRS